jgi:hypothetical protein
MMGAIGPIGTGRIDPGWAKMEATAVVDRLPDLRLEPDQPKPQVGGSLMRSAPTLHMTW